MPLAKLEANLWKGADVTEVKPLVGEGFDHDKHKASADYACPIIMDRGTSRTLTRTVKEGFEHAAKRLGIKDGEIVPMEKPADFTGLMMEKLSTFIKLLVRNGRLNGRP